MNDDPRTRYYPRIRTWGSWVGIGRDWRGCSGVHSFEIESVSAERPITIRCGRCDLVVKRGKTTYENLVATDTDVSVEGDVHTCALPHVLYLVIFEEEPETPDDLTVEIPDSLPAEFAEEAVPA